MTITDNGNYITFTFASTNIVNLPKECLIISLDGNYINITAINGVTLRIIYSSVSTPVVTNAADLETILLGYTLTGGRIVESFTSTNGQTDFITTFPANSSTQVFIDGYRMITGWSIISGVVTFNPGLNTGQQVIIETF